VRCAPLEAHLDALIFQIRTAPAHYFNLSLVLPLAVMVAALDFLNTTQLLMATFI